MEETGTPQTTLLIVKWNDHGEPDRDWGYHLRMGGIDAEEVDVALTSADLGRSPWYDAVRAGIDRLSAPSLPLRGGQNATEEL